MVRKHSAIKGLHWRYYFLTAISHTWNRHLYHINIKILAGKRASVLHRQAARAFTAPKCKVWKSDVKIKVSLKSFFLFFKQNICCGYSKEQSQRDCSFEYPKHMFKLMEKKIIAILFSKILLNKIIFGFMEKLKLWPSILLLVPLFYSYLNGEFTHIWALTPENLSSEVCEQHRRAWSAPLLFAYWKVSYLDLLRVKFQISR